MELRRQDIQPVVQAALAEDLPWGDATTDNLIDDGWRARAAVIARADGVVAGLPLLAETFRAVDPALSVQEMVDDGRQVRQGDNLAVIEGAAGSLLRAERVALNFLQRLSGIATLTAQYVGAVEGLPCRIIDTRKTTPGLRRLEKYAVRAGGGHNHRFGLSDGVLIKDNHLALLQERGVSMKEAIAAMRQRLPHTIRIEVEVESLEALEEALAAGIDALLLDNMSPQQLREAVAAVAGRAITEASGGITLETVRAVAESGVDLISVGALTHSVPALDLSLDIQTGAADTL